MHKNISSFYTESRNLIFKLLAAQLFKFCTSIILMINIVNVSHILHNNTTYFTPVMTANGEKTYVTGDKKILQALFVDARIAICSIINLVSKVLK